MQKPLTVYKASAGSGKTFTLATEYIKLLIQNPLSYRHILAVTFTNKATEEMKMRILSQLYGIWKQLPDSQVYTDKVVKELGVTPEFASKQAGIALNMLLHNYNYFRVETIDTFFQSVLRNLARELDLTANLRVELNDLQIEYHAVDELIESLDTKSKILKWMMDYIYENISNDKAWNVIGGIKEFGKNIFHDYYKENRKELEVRFADEEFFPRYIEKIRQIRKDALEQIKSFADRFFDALEDHSLSIEDFSSGKSGVCGYFIKIRKGEFDEGILTKTVLKCMEDPKEWVRKKEAKPGNPAMDLVNDTLFDLLREAEKQRPHLFRMYKSADITLKHLNQLRLLGSIEKQVRAMNTEANRFLLSDTQDLLHSLIDGSDSPFIFEKIGTQLEHVMIDEFQDTSVIQWKNFKVLLEECMSHEHSHNMLVGDVKQSIYRWRSGDWRLLNNIQDEFPTPEKSLDITSLDRNFRSERNIIEFNNTFFKKAVEAECSELSDACPEGVEQYRRAYEDVCQQVPDDKPASGLVQIKLFPKDDKTYEDNTYAYMEETIHNLLQQGVTPDQIAILVRYKKNIPDIAEWFLQHMPDVRIVSDEAFRLDASQAVNTLITALRYIANPEDLIVREILLKTGIKLNGEEPTAFFEQAEKLKTMPLFDMIEEIYSLFQLSRLKEQSAYVCAFYDQLNAYLTDNPGDIEALITEWEDNLCAKTIQSDEITGIRIMTIHKSKGLEFDHVFLPFCDWKLEKINTLLWCHPTEAPFDQLPLVPLDFSEKNLKGTIYEKDYQHEHLQNMVDNMNLLYVAFTRAGKSLFITGKQGNGRAKVIEQVFENVALELGEDASIQKSGSDKGEIFFFEYGSLPAPSAKHDDDTAAKTLNVFKHPTHQHPVTIENFETKTEFRQSNKSRDFIEGDEEEEQQKGYIRMGNILHHLFSTIHTAADIDNAIRKLELDGILYDESITPDKLRAMLHKRLQTPQVAEWFSDKWQVFNECSILHVDADTHEVREHRPDRVITDGKQMIVIDFKFGKPKPEYHEQVRQYMALLQDMGYQNVTGYLWYVYTNQIETV